METLSYVMSALSLLCACIASVLKGKNMRLILLLMFLTNVMMAVSYVPLGSFNGTVSSGIGGIITIINYLFERGGKPLPKWLVAVYAATLFVVNLLVFSRPADVLVIVAAMAFVMGVSQKNGKGFRLWTLVNTSSWVVYDAITLAFGPLTTHATIGVTIIAGMLIHDRKTQADKKTAE